MDKKRTIVVWLVATSLLAILLTACGATSGGGPTPTPLPPVVSYEKAIYTVELGPIVSEKKIYGEIVPSKQDDLYFKASGYVDRVLVKQGDTIKQGDLLAEMQVSDLLDQLQQANIDLEVSQQTLDKDNSQRDYNIQKAQIDVTVAEKNVEIAQLDMDNAYTKDAKERAQLHLDILNENLAAAQLNLKQAQEAVGTYEEQAVQRNQITVNRLQKLIDERRVYAPYDGIVLRTSIRPGIQINAFDTVMSVGDPSVIVARTQVDYDLNQTMTDQTEVRMYLPNDDTSGPGTPVTFMPNFMPLTAEESTAQQNTTLGQNYFYFSLPTTLDPTKAKVGVSVTLIVVVGRKDSTLLLPPAAIRQYRGQNFVIVLKDSRRVRVEITQIGLKTVDKWEVFGDLQAGDQVEGP